MMECIVPSPPKPPPTYNQFLQVESYPSRCDPYRQPAVCAPEGPPGFVCVAEDRFPPHPYAPKPPDAEWERLPCVQLPPPVPRAVCAVPNYYPQPALRNYPPPCGHPPCPQPPCCEFEGAAGAAALQQKVQEKEGDESLADWCADARGNAAGDGPAVGPMEIHQKPKVRRSVEGEQSAGVPAGCGVPYFPSEMKRPALPPPPCELILRAEAEQARRRQFEALGRPPTPIKHQFNPRCFEPLPVPEPPPAGVKGRTCPIEQPPRCLPPPAPPPCDPCMPVNPCIPVHPSQLPPDPDIVDYLPLGCPPVARAGPPPQLEEVREYERRQNEVCEEKWPTKPPVCRDLPLPPVLPGCKDILPCQYACPPEALAKIMLSRDPKLPYPKGPPCYIPPQEPPRLPPAPKVNPPDPSVQPPCGGRLPPCYLPQPTDMPPAVGRGLSGFGGCGGDERPILRPVVDKYSLTRYTDCDWRRHNEEVMRNASQVQYAANVLDYSARRCIERCATRADTAQETATKALRGRAQEIVHWRCRLERALVAVSEEVNLLQQQRHRLKTAMSILQLPESIAAECIAVRQQRLDCDLVRDDAEEELIREAQFMNECRGVMERALKQLECQIESNINIKTKCEYDWSDKKMAHDIEEMNIAYNVSSTNILFRPGATRIPDNQASLQAWDVNTKEIIEILEAELEKSKSLRAELDRMMADMIRAMRNQADRVEILLEKSVSMIVECKERLENDLKQVLRRIVDSEKLLSDLRDAIRAQDASMKKVQTRLCHRLARPRAENCRDTAQEKLLDEVRVVSGNVSNKKSLICQTEENLRCLIHTRNVIERELQHKTHALFITRDRIRAIRAHYPSAASMTGY